MIVKLVILDVDGVLTDGKKNYGQDGFCFGKRFCDKDFTVIKKLKSCGVSVCFCSGDKNINKSIAENRNIDFYDARNVNKTSFIETFKKTYNCSIEEMLYIGDDIFDVDLLKSVGFSLCPSDAAPEVKRVCDKVLDSRGGDNILMELFSFLEKESLVSNFDFELFLKLDESEKF